jgi:glycine dehydrogenase subunit 2
MPRVGEPLIFDQGRPGRRATTFPKPQVPVKEMDELIPKAHRREKPLPLPEVSELQIVRHYTRLSQLNFSVDTHFYPLGSCTMKYNPKRNDRYSTLDAFLSAHPYQPEALSQGIFEILHTLERSLSEICGVNRFSLQPTAGAQSEFTGLMMVRAYHEERGEHKTIILVPDSSHGTNPASAALMGYQVQTVKSNKEGLIDLNDLKKHLTPQVACLMLTNPSTLGLFEKNILDVARWVHEIGGLLYYDGANLNPLLGRTRPGDMGFDIVHLNLHKTFSTPHGGGGPGAGPIGVQKHLVDYLPSPLIGKKDTTFFFEPVHTKSVGQVRAFYGNVNILIKAYIYIRTLGEEGLRRVGTASVLNANYLLKKLSKFFQVPFNSHCMHEFVLSVLKKNPNGIRTLDIGKRLLDFGIHAPTTYFPLNVKEALMIEPTETESKETLDLFVQAMKQIAEEAQHDPEKLKGAPWRCPVSRPDEVRAARTPKLTWKGKEDKEASCCKKESPLTVS